MDQTDYEIIKILCRDARIPFQQIAKTLGIGTDTVIRRYKKLKEEGVILGATILLSSQVCGYKGLLGIFLKAKDGADISAIKQKLIDKFKPNLCSQTLGEYDFYVQLFFTDIGETVETLRKMRELKEFNAIDPMFFSLEDWPIPDILTIDSDPPDWAVSNS